MLPIKVKGLADLTPHINPKQKTTDNRPLTLLMEYDTLGQKKQITMTDIKAKYLGGMVGSALGDAIGELAFHYPSKDDLCIQLDRLKEFRYTDGSAMSIGLAESILKKGCLDQQDLGEIFRKNFKREPWRGYASGPPKPYSPWWSGQVLPMPRLRALYLEVKAPLEMALP